MISRLEIIVPYFKKKKKFILVIFLLTVFSNFSNIYSTYILGKVIDLLSKKNIVQIRELCIILILIKLSIIFISNFLNSINPIIQADIVFDIEKLFLTHIKKLPMKFFEKINPIYLNARLNQDINEVVNTVLYGITGLTIEFLSLIIIFVYFLLNEKIIFLILVISMPVYIFVYCILENRLFEKNYMFKEEQNKFFSVINLQLENISFIKLNSIFSKLNNDLENAFSPLRRAIKKYSILNSLFGGMFSIVDTIFFMVFLIYGISEIYHNKMSIGDFIVIQSFFGYAITEITSITAFIKKIPEFKVSLSRLMEIYSYEEEINGKLIITDITSVKVSNLSFKDIIKNANHEFKKDNIYMISGKNGKGKTTLIKCLLGLYINDYSGNILYNGIDIKNLNMYDIREKYISYVDQECFQMYYDIDKDIDICGVKDNEFKNLLLDKFSLNCSDNTNFSGGERQKISIIRAFLKSNSSLLIFDEPTASLDIESKRKFLDLVSEYSKNKIIIIISHDEYILNFEKFKTIKI